MKFIIPLFVFLFTVTLKAQSDFKYNPNATLIRHPTFVQAIKNNSTVQAIKKTQIINSKLASVGAVIYNSAKGLMIIPKEKIKKARYKMSYIGSQQKKAQTVGKYRFIPDTLWTSEEDVHIFQKNSEIEDLLQSQLLSKEDSTEIAVGDALSCPEKDFCYIIHVKDINENYDISYKHLLI